MMSDDARMQAPRAVDVATVDGGPVVLIASPHAGSAQGIDAAQVLEAAGVKVDKRLDVDELDHDAPQGAEWLARGYRAAIAAGGDGTIGAVATQVAGSNLPMGILPLGTANDVARSLMIPLDPAEASSVIATGRATRVDAGQALPATTEPAPYVTDAAERAERQMREGAGAYFIHALTLGLNVEFARLATNVARRQRWGNLNYATAVLEAITRYEPVEVKLHLRDARRMQAPNQWGNLEAALTVEARVIQVAVANSPVFGGGMGVRLSGVNLHDSMLDFIVLEALEARHLRETVDGLLEALDRLRDTFTGNGERQQGQSGESDNSGVSFMLPGVQRYQAREGLLRTAQPLDVTLDGEIRSHTPVTVKAVNGPILILLPEKSPYFTRRA